MPNDLLPRDWESWEPHPSTRTSIHVYTKWAPVDSTLTTPGTAQNLYLIAPGVPTVNLATNPSMETGSPPTGYTASGATIAQSATVARSGTNSLRITPNNAAAGEGAYWTTDVLGDQPDDSNALYLVSSSYFNDNAGSGNGARVVIADASGTTLVNGNTVTLAANWTGRSTAALRLPQRTPARYRIYFVTATQFGTVFYTDNFQIELLHQNTATTYCDGDQGLNYEWDGTANASESRRRKGLTIIRGFDLHCTRDMYISYDVTASSTTGRFVRAGTDFWIDHPRHIRSRISFINVNPGETPRVYGELQGIHFSQGE